MSSWKDRARVLADELQAMGVLTAEWRVPFELTPRHIFVPRFYRPDGTLVDGAKTQMSGEWLRAVYSDDSLTTQRRVDPGSERAIPTSSSTRPSLMALMLKMLDVQDGNTVLEIGTGTGYNAGLISRRVGGDQVTSIDIDEDLVANAKMANETIGLAPHLVSGNGADGVPWRAPY